MTQRVMLGNIYSMLDIDQIEEDCAFTYHTKFVPLNVDLIAPQFVGNLICRDQEKVSSKVQTRSHC